MNCTLEELAVLRLLKANPKAAQLTIATVEDGQVLETVTLDAPEHEHGAMPRFIAANGCTDGCGGHQHDHEC